MEDLITKQQAIDALRTCYDTETITMDNGDEYIHYGDAVGEIEQLPPIQPKRGHWIEADVCGDTTSWECSCCHNWTGLPTGWNVKAKLWFCPKCTADMREANYESN